MPYRRGPSERDRRIVERYLEGGVSQATVGKEHGLSATRVNQIVRKYWRDRTTGANDGIDDLCEQLHAIIEKSGYDPEIWHIKADNTLLAIIERLIDAETSAQIAADFNAITKWYA